MARMVELQGRAMPARVSGTEGYAEAAEALLDQRLSSADETIQLAREHGLGAVLNLRTASVQEVNAARA